MRKNTAQTLFVMSAACALTLATGCQSEDHGSAHAATKPMPAASKPASAPSIAPASAPTSAAAPVVLKLPVRIKAGLSAPFTDSAGNVWLADQGFDGGDVIERDAGIVIDNTKEPSLYRTEHFGMNSFSCAIPNGNYLARLHFAETFEGITGAGQRVFSLNVQGKEFKDFDVFVKAGGANRAYIESVPVEITNGKFTITFTSNVENPEINAIEIVAQP